MMFYHQACLPFLYQRVTFLLRTVEQVVGLEVLDPLLIGGT